MDYKQKIIEMVEEIENLWILEQTLQFIHNMTKEEVSADGR
ncbi:MAG: hypothetical protein ACLRZ9_13015 [Eubacterium sp.]